MVGTVVGAVAQATTLLNSANVGGASAPTPTFSTPNSSAPSTQQVTTSSTLLDQEQINIASIGPIQTYVVETEMTTTQGDIAQIQNQATFG
jgi:hypothetical protein